MKKIDWTKPIRFLNSEADYVGRTHSKCRPNVVATMPTVNEHCDLYLVDDFGCDRSGAQIVTNAPEPKRVYSDVRMTLDLSKPPFRTRDGMPMHFVGQTKDGRTVWEYAANGTVVIRHADGRKYEERPSGDDVINIPPPKAKETLWAVVFPPGSQCRGHLYQSQDAALTNSPARDITPIPVEVEYTKERK